MAPNPFGWPTRLCFSQEAQADADKLTEEDLSGDYGSEASARADSHQGRMFSALRFLRLRVPIRVQLSIIITFIVLVTVLVLSVVILGRVREQFYDHAVQTGKVSLTYFANSAALPMINDDMLSLNRTLREAKSVEILVYAIAVDNSGKIMGHTDVDRIGAKLPRFENIEAIHKEQDNSITYFNHRDDQGRYVLNLAKPITLRDTRVGTMHAGISLDFIDELTRHESLFIVILSAFIVLLGISTAIILGVGFSRPIQQLVTATREIGRGNFLYRIRTARNDEFGDLAESFNYMAEELQQKLEIQKSFGQYVSPDIVEMILKNPEGGWLKGAKGEVSILFADVRGFTSFSETRDPEHVVEELNEYFAVATTAILDHGGYVDKFIGDAVLGVFGAPVHREDHIERAVNAAMQMQESFARRAKETGHYVCGHIGVALHSGEVVSGNIGSEVKMEYTVIGDHVNLASRLNGLAESGEIVISETVYSAVADRFQVEDMPAATLKGKSKPVKVFKITGYK